MKKMALLIVCIFNIMAYAKSDGAITHINTDPNPNVPDGLQYSKYWLDLLEKDAVNGKIGNIYEKNIDVEKKLKYVEALKISNRPYKVVLNNTMFVKAHPQYPFSLIFPKGYMINHVSSFGREDLNWDFDKTKNIIDVQASDDLTVQTLMVKFADMKGNKFATNIIVNRFVNKNDILHNMYEIVEPKTLNVDEVIKRYVLKYGSFPEKTTYIKLDGVVYYFEEDRDGTIELGDKKFNFRYGNEQ